MTNTTLNLGSNFVVFNYASGMLQMQSNIGKDYKPISAEELDTIITWFIGVRQNMEKQKEVKE